MRTVPPFPPKLLSSLSSEPLTGADCTIAGLTADSRAVGSGFLFAALPGSKVDGRAFIPQALSAGAAAVLAPTGTTLPPEAKATLVESGAPRRALAQMAAAFYGAQPASVSAVTGTNGKTSVAVFTAALWALLGKKTASLGTLGVQGANGKTLAGFEDVPALTTPDPVALQSVLARLAAAGVEHLAMEASSHGLDQFRLDGVHVDVAAFTNLSRDHLDYHKTMAAYRTAKARLFADLLSVDGTAVLNRDIADYESLAALCRRRGIAVLSFGEREGADIRLLERQPTATGQDIVLDHAGRRTPVSLSLMGAFQAENVMAALGSVIAGGADPASAIAALEKLRGAPGRMEPVGMTSYGAAVFVDYAHTSDALETALAAARPHCTGRLICVFGAGGDRDRGKRPAMGAAVATGADIGIVTDDNPRTEDPAVIRADVLAGAQGLREIGDRADAIAMAIAEARSGDLVLIAGKGHENGQTIGNAVHAFNDRDVARSAIAAQGDGFA